jgi:hypothetical protein
MKSPRHTAKVSHLELKRIANQRDYWRRKVLKPGYDAARKKKWRQSNPRKYAAELKKNRERWRRNASKKRLSPQK